MESDRSEGCSGVPRRGFIIASAALMAPGMAAAEDGPVTVKDVDRYRVYDPAFECVRVALSSRGERYTPAYIQGISGAGFRMAGPCPCAPTCAMAMSQAALVRLLGYEVEEMTFGGSPDPKARLAQIVARIKEEVRARRPVVVFHAFTSAEWDVVCGYDEAKREFLGRIGYQSMLGKEYVRADEGRMATCGDICPPIGALVIGKKVGRLDARSAEIAAIREAVRHARDTTRKDYPFNGLAAYDRWLESWRASDVKPDWLRDGYISAVYSSTHKAGADFLKQIARKHPAAAHHLTRAAGFLDMEARELHSVLARLFPPEGKPRLSAEDARKEIPPVLARARTHCSAAAQALNQAVATLWSEKQIPRHARNDVQHAQTDV